MLTNIVRIVSQTVRKITYKILGVKKLILPGKRERVLNLYTYFDQRDVYM